MKFAIEGEDSSAEITMRTLRGDLSVQENTYLPLDDRQRYFYSHDLGLVAYLLCLGKYELAGMDKAVRAKVLFILTRGEGIDQAAKEYWDFKSSVDAQTFFNQLKRLKNQIHSSD